MSARLALLVFLAGGCGAVCRYGLSEALARAFGHGLPLGTFAVNILGSFLFGVVWELACVRLMLSEAARVALCVGFMGSFTTFSSLMFDSWALLQDRPALFAANLAAQLALGFAALVLGFHAARLV